MKSASEKPRITNSVRHEARNVVLAPFRERQFRNILAGSLRRGQLTLQQAISVQTEAASLMAWMEFDVRSTDVLTLVQASDCSASNCEFVALARSQQTQLVTMDKKILRAFPQIARPLPTE